MEKNEEEKCEENVKKINLIKKYNIDLSITKSILHFDDFQFYLTKIILSEIWIFRLTNLTEKSKIDFITQNIIDEKEKERIRSNNVVKIDSCKDEVLKNGNGSEMSNEGEKKNQLENDKKIKNNISEVRKKSLGDKKKENKGKENVIEIEKEKECEYENGNDRDCDGNRSPHKRTAVRTKTIDEEKVTVEVKYVYHEIS